LRIALVSIARFACAVEVQRNPRLARTAFIVGDAEQPKRVLDCSFNANSRHVRPGMTIRKALGLCPQAAIVSPDLVLYHKLWHSILSALAEISPEVENDALGRAYLNANGLQLRYRGDDDLASHLLAAVRRASGLTASIGIAEGKFPALAAALITAPGDKRVVPFGAEASFLAPLAVELLPTDPEIISRLRLLGFETLGDVSALSVPELQSQFGFEGRRLAMLANGIDERPLRSQSGNDAIASGLSFEAPVGGIDILIAAAKQLLSRLQLALQGRAARELTVQAELVSGRGWERRLVFREAISEADRLAYLLRSTLQNTPPPMAVQSLTLQLSKLASQTGKQLYMAERSRLDQQLQESIRQLKARYGYSPVYRCVDIEPWSVIPEERQLLVESDV
jgi:nucleotidyltransferase/DNA polymerase involved in DNA repair